MLENYFKNGSVMVHKGTFSVAKAKEPVEDAFALLQDGNEITLVLKDSDLEKHKSDITEINSGWRVITFDMLLPLELVGFIAKVATVLADEGIDILTFSAYSTEHVLVKENDLQKALRKLQSLGCRIKEV